MSDALKNDPTSGAALVGLGVAAYASGDIDGAFAHYHKRALAIDPSISDAYYNVGCEAALSGEADLALAAINFRSLQALSSHSSSRRIPTWRICMVIRVLRH